MQNHNYTKRICLLSLFIALAIIISFIESMIPLPIPIPGIKIGLANMITMIVLYYYGFIPAIIVSLLRVIIIGIVFTNMYMMIYSLSGALLSMIIMMIALKSHLFSETMVCILGAIFHNIGQLMIAIIFFQSFSILYYFPYLVLGGLISGLLIGLFCAYIFSRYSKILKKEQAIFIEDNKKI